MFKIPILILGYNRPDKINKIIKALELIKPKNIYFHIDGAKKNYKDKILVQKVKTQINCLRWKAKINKKYSSRNLGCRDLIINGLDWFFKREKMGIILEDDCIPSEEFFYFTKLLLNKYKNDEKIFSISGYNPLDFSSRKSYYFSKYSFCWGWATWKRSYIQFKKISKASNWNKSLQKKFLTINFSSNLEFKYWKKIFINTFNKKIDTWDYIWQFSSLINNKLNVIPTKNLIKNIGFDNAATHTINNSLLKFYFKYKSIMPLIFNQNKKNNNTIEKKIFFKLYKPKNYLYPWRILYISRYLFLHPFSFFRKFLKTFFKINM